MDTKFNVNHPLCLVLNMKKYILFLALIPGLLFGAPNDVRIVKANAAGTANEIVVLADPGADKLIGFNNTTNDVEYFSAGTVTSVGFTGGLISVASPTTTPAFTVAGTSGGVPYFSSTSAWASSGLLAANALMIGGGAGTAPATTTTGTGVLTALGVNTGSAGSFALFGANLKTTWVSRDTGSDVTGVVGQPNQPFATILAAHNACVTATGQWMINVQPSATVYTDVGMSSVLCSYYFEPGAQLSNLSGNVDCFPLSTGTVDSWGIYGHGTFIVNSAGTGGIVNHTGGSIGRMVWEGLSTDVLASGGSNQTGAYRTFANLTGSGNGNLTVRFNNLSSSANMASLYIRANHVLMWAGFASGVTLEGSSSTFAFVGEATKWSVSPNNFGSPQLRLTANRGLKGSDGTPALLVRSGKILIRGACIYSGGGAPSSSRASILEITSQSNTEAATVRVIFEGCSLGNWTTPANSGAAPLIRFPAFSGALVQLQGAALLVDRNNGATECITTQGAVAQVVELTGGGATSNAALGTNVTFRGAPFTVDTDFTQITTDFH